MIAHPAPSRGIPSLLAILVVVSCKGDPARDEAANLVRLVSDLRDAPNHAKRAPLDRLASMPCSFPDVCAARDACIDAFRHHVRGMELGASLHASLDGSAPDAGTHDSTALGIRLLEMNVEIEEANARMPLCDEKIASLRVAHKV
jgi:hypothetical protein